ncbi:MAG: hypothetical protein NTW94_08245 [Legionellales bacterium]|nr:hypothetical protein [Legionellales bacterium]
MNVTHLLLPASLIIMTSAYYYPRWHRSRLKKRWFNELNLDKHHATFLQLVRDINGFALSRQARNLHDAMEYTYGEIDFIPFIALLYLTKPNANTVFYDLGSGVGKAVLACALVFDVKKSCGIELFENLHHAALLQHHRLQQTSQDHGKSQRIHFIHANFLSADFSDATLIFINATALFGETWHALNERLAKVNPGTLVISTSKKLISDDFLLQHTTRVAMSWGIVHAYIQQRKINHD